MKRWVCAVGLVVAVLAAALVRDAAASCRSDGECGDGYYCYRIMGDCDGTGVCTLRPKVCPMIWYPVCGCDDNTYSNACTAAAAGVNVKHLGQCEPGCSDNSNCGADYYCSKATGDCNGKGICSPRPTVCVQIWAPVCGCDGNTYANSCEAAVAGVNVKYAGECLPGPAGPVVIMMEPRTTHDGVHTGASGLDYLRILWSEPIIFAASDVNITDENGQAVEFTVSGNSSTLMTIRFTKKLLYDMYTVTVSDSACSLISGYPIDGDDSGVAGGDAVIIMEHRMRSDFDNNNRVNLADLAIFAESWLNSIP